MLCVNGKEWQVNSDCREIPVHLNSLHSNCTLTPSESADFQILHSPIQIQAVNYVATTVECEQCAVADSDRK